MKTIATIFTLIILTACGGSGGGGGGTASCKAFKSTWDRTDGTLTIDLSNSVFNESFSLKSITEDDDGVYDCYYDMTLVGNESSGRVSLDYNSTVSNNTSARDDACLTGEGIDNYTMSCNKITVCDQTDTDDCVYYE